MVLHGFELIPWFTNRQSAETSMHFWRISVKVALQLAQGAPTTFGKKHPENIGGLLARCWRAVGAIIHPISAPKMEGASIFLHVASGFLKKYSPEAEES